MCNMYPAYLRGEAYLRAGQPDMAAAEFQRFLDHPGAVSNFVTGALAHMQLGRAQAKKGDRTGAASSYKHFFRLWREADPNIPIYRQAQSEYAKLR
jgi:eukaryotic-like serine/threonine-protein kinase